ncbi:MAG: hypothetical protein QOF51_2300, partial [Chloroflexota bacterium]|nr:hypothetical protein [Chloroflexota bacterium]
MKRVGICVLLVLPMLLAACGSDDGSGGGGSGGGAGGGGAKDLQVTWTYYGPENDGAYNTANIVSAEAADQMPGVTVDQVFNIPYSQQASQIIKQAIAGGSNAVVDTAGLANLLTDVCKQAPQVACLAAA